MKKKLVKSKKKKGWTLTDKIIASVAIFATIVSWATIGAQAAISLNPINQPVLDTSIIDNADIAIPNADKTKTPSNVSSCGGSWSVCQNYSCDCQNGLFAPCKPDNAYDPKGCYCPCTQTAPDAPANLITQ